MKNLINTFLILITLFAAGSSAFASTKYKVDLECRNSDGDTMYVLESLNGDFSIWWKGVSMYVDDFFSEKEERFVMADARSFIMSIDRKSRKPIKQLLASRSKRLAAGVGLYVYKAKLQFKNPYSKPEKMKCRGYIR